MKKLLSNNWPILVLVFLSVFIVWPLFLPGYFSHHDDLQIMRIFEMRKCLTDFQVPCRWVPDMGYGNGYPLFNFYGVFPYYLGAFLSFLFGYVASAKILFFVPLTFGGIAMYLLGKELFGRIPGFATGVLYSFAPYRALDTYVRGDIAEMFAISLVPLILFLILRLIKSGENKYFFLASVGLAAFFITHNIMTLLFTPVIILFTVFWLFESKWGSLSKVASVFILGLGMSAFFIIPAYFEKNLVQVNSLTVGELDFRAQFVKVGQLFFDRSWNYGGSSPDKIGTISYQIGWPHWWLVVAALVGFLALRRKRFGMVVLLFLLFAIAAFMTHNKSAFIWEKIKILSFVQFPWRFLSIAIFSASLLGGYFISFFKEKWMIIFAVLISVLTIGLNYQYFKPEHFYYDMTDAKKLSGQNFIDQQKGALLDYLPVTAVEPRELAPKEPLFISGTGSVKNFVNKSNSWKFGLRADTDSDLVVPVLDFPNWTVFVNGSMYPHSRNNIPGRIEIKLPKGNYEVSGIFENTKIRTISNLISLLSFVGLILIYGYGKNRKVFS